MPIDMHPGLLTALATLGGLMLIQLLIADVTGIRRRHIPGTPVTPDHADTLFRVTRCVANTNESIGIFVVLLLFCLFAGASPLFTTYAVWAYVICRILYAICYYANVPTFRSISFGASLLALLSLLVIGLTT